VGFPSSPLDSSTETTTLPPYGGIGSEIDIPGKTHTEKWEAVFQLVSEGYFPTLGLRLIRGRLLSEAEVNDARKVAVINQTFVSRYFGSEDPLGHRIKLAFLETVPNGKVEDPFFEIVGVISDVKNRGIQDPPMPEVLVPYTVSGVAERGILVRTRNAPEALLNSVRREIWAVDSNVALTNTGTLSGFLKQYSYAAPRFSLTLLGIFASVGLILVAVGVYSVIAYTVSRQTHEIGIRMALGAHRRDVLGMVLRQGMLLALIGVVVGLVSALFATRWVATMIYGVSTKDPLTFVAVPVALALVALLANYLPARRATRVDPLVALRHE